MSDYAYAYHPPVAPVMPAVPSPDLAAQTIAHFGTAGLQAFVQMNAARQRSDLEARQLAQQAVFQQQNYELEKQKQDHAIQASDELLPLQKQLLQSHADLFENKAKEWANGQATAAQRLINFNQQLQKVQNDARGYADELHLTDPQFQSTDPVAFAANLQKFKDAYGNATPSTGIRQQIGQWQTIADQQKVNVSMNGKNTVLPIWQVVEGVTDPNTHDIYRKALIDAGHITEQQVADQQYNAWDKLLSHVGLKDKPTSHTVDTPNDPAGKMLNDWITGKKTVDWSHVPSRIPMDMARNAGQYAAQQHTTAGGGDANLNPTSPDGSAANNSAPLPGAGPTGTDQAIAAARDAISKGAPADQVAARLQSAGIDPSALDGE